MNLPFNEDNLNGKWIRRTLLAFISRSLQYLPVKNISPFSFSNFVLYQDNILQQFKIKYLFPLLIRAYANFQLERPSRTLLMLIFVVMALAENTYTRFPWLFDPVLSFPGSWYVGNVLPGVHWLNITAIVSLNNTIKSICW